MSAINNNIQSHTKAIQASTQKYIAKSDLRSIISGVLGLFGLIPGVVYYMWTSSQEKKTLEELKNMIRSTPLLNENGEINAEAKKAYTEAIKILPISGSDNILDPDSKVNQERMDLAQKNKSNNFTLSYFADKINDDAMINLVLSAPIQIKKSLDQAIKDYPINLVDDKTVGRLAKDFPSISREEITEKLRDKTTQYESLCLDINSIESIENLDPMIDPKGLNDKANELADTYDLFSKNNISDLLIQKITYGRMPVASNVKIALINTPTSGRSRANTMTME